MTCIAKLLGFAQPAPDEPCLERSRALARARARILVLSIAETASKPPEARRRRA